MTKFIVLLGKTRWSQKVTLSALEFCSKQVCAEILTERAIKNEAKEIHSIVQKGQKIKPKQPNGDYFTLASFCAGSK